MPRYFFDIQDGLSYRDAEGLEMPDIGAARAQAMQVAAAYAGDPRMLREDGGAIVVTIRDGDGITRTVRLVFSVEDLRGAPGLR